MEGDYERMEQDTLLIADLPFDAVAESEPPEDSLTAQVATLVKLKRKGPSVSWSSAGSSGVREPASISRGSEADSDDGKGSRFGFDNECVQLHVPCGFG
jgi:hypothetical protein